MKLLFESESVDEISRWKSTFEDHGVPVFISGKESFRVYKRLVNRRLGFWIMLDSQYESACKFYKNEISSISNPVDMVAFRESINSQKYAINEKASKFAFCLLIASTLFFLLLFAFYK